jgi:hypothetical protein
MSSKKKNILNESSEVYETSSKTITEELHPVLIKLLEKAAQEASEGKFISHEEAMRRIKEKIASLK